MPLKSEGSERSGSLCRTLTPFIASSRRSLNVMRQGVRNTNESKQNGSILGDPLISQSSFGGVQTLAQEVFEMWLLLIYGTLGGLTGTTVFWKRLVRYYEARLAGRSPCDCICPGDPHHKITPRNDGRCDCRVEDHYCWMMPSFRHILLPTFIGLCVWPSLLVLGAAKRVAQRKLRAAQAAENEQKLLREAGIDP